MQTLVDTLIIWLQADPNRAKANQIAMALAKETRKRLVSPDPEQREFDAEELAIAAEPDKQWDFDRAKKWVTNAAVDRYLDLRRVAIEDHFRDAGLTQCLCLEKLPTTGKHRTRWRLTAYDIGEMVATGEASAKTDAVGERHEQSAPCDVSLGYERSQPGSVKPSWWVWPLVRSGSFRTRSTQGALWAGLVFLAIGEVLVCAFFLWSFTLQRRPLLASDLAEGAGLTALIWAIWAYQLRPMFNLAEDRIIPVGESWVGFREAPAQLELAKVDGHRVVRLVRYTAVCPVCSGQVELRYAPGKNRRRLVGCCEETPYEHVFTFDRVLLQGRRLRDL